MNHLLHMAINSAVNAGKAIMNVYNSGDFDIQNKEDSTPLTKADMISHTVINRNLGKSEIPILSEEGKHIPYEERESWNLLWIVDPLDGTKEFIKRNGEFTVNIALIENQKPLMGVIFVPVSGELYFSTKDIGAFKVFVDINNFDVEFLISNAKRLPFENKRKNFTIVASRSHMSVETSRYIKEMKVKYGSVDLISKGSSLKLCMVAEGKADIYPRFAPTMEWDTAAGQAICEHSGFNVIDLNTGKNILYNRKNLLNNSFLVK